MALAISELNSVSKKHFDRTMLQHVYESSPLYGLLKARKRVIDGGTSLQFPLRYKKLDRANAVGPREKLTFQSVKTRTGADVDWTYYAGEALIHWDEDVKNSGQGKIIDLVGDKTEELQEDMEDQFNADVYVTNPNGNGLTPITDIVDSGTAYAGIAVADAAEWAANTEDTTTTQLALYGSNSISSAVNAAEFGAKGVTHIITTRDLKSKFESILQPLTRYMREDESAKKAGFRNFMFHDVTVVSDYACTANLLLGLDLDSIGCYHYTGEPNLDPWTDLTVAGLPRAAVRIYTWVGNLIATRRKTSFKFTALDYTA
jgi:hypothetical protein